MFFKNSDSSLKEAQICVPLTASNLDDLVLLVDNAVIERPDLLEWRVDGFGEILSQGALIEIISAIVEHGRARQFYLHGVVTVMGENTLQTKIINNCLYGQWKVA